MDMTLLTGAVGALANAIEIGKGAVALRDARKLSDVVVTMNEKLLEAQQSLFGLSGALNSLQQENFQTAQELRELKEALAQRQRYTLFEIVPGTFVYRMDVTPKGGGSTEPSGAQSECYFCQFCLDGTPNRPVALRFIPAAEHTGASWFCVGCRTSIHDPSRPALNPGWGRRLPRERY